MISLQNVSRYYAAGERSVHALESVSLTITRHEFVAVVGPSGCGKSTLLMLISGLIPATTGPIEVGGAPVKGADRNVAVLVPRDALHERRAGVANVLLAVGLLAGLYRCH